MSEPEPPALNPPDGIAPGGTSDGEPAPRQDGAGSLTRTQWVAVFCSAFALAAMAGVLVLAKQRGDAAEPAAPARPPSDIDKFGPPAKRGPDPRVLGCGPIDPDKPPAVEFELEDETLDLGRLKQGVEFEQKVVFTNTGTGPLCVAKKPVTGCGCLKARLVEEKTRFEPGESGTIAVAIDTTGRVGKVRKTVTLISNAVDTPRRSFRVLMDVAEGLIADPRFLQFGNVPPHTPATRTLFVRAPKGDGAWEVTGVEGTRSLPGIGLTKYSYEVERADDAKHVRYKIDITHPGLDATGQTRDVLRITTTHPDRKSVELTALIHVRPRIVSRTRVISLGFVSGGASRPPMTTRIQPGVPDVVFEIRGVKVVPPEGKPRPPGGPGFEAEFGRDARGWWVKVRYDGKSRGPGLLEAVLVVETDDESQPEVRVPIRATIRQPRK